MLNLIELFDSLPIPHSSGSVYRFNAHLIEELPSCSVGKDISGYPVLLISTNNIIEGVTTPITLKSISVMHLVNCRISVGQKEIVTKTLSVIRCTDGDRIFHEYFLRCLQPIIASLPQKPTSEQVGVAIERLVALFKQMTETPKKTLAGLWAELFIIAHSSDPSFLLNAWHTFPEERYDFSHNEDRLEVKATTGPSRIHHFSLEQLRPTSSANVVIASLFIERVGTGQNLNDLVDMLHSRVQEPEILARMYEIIARTVGTDWRIIAGMRFDSELAASSLRFIESAHIPSVGLPLPLQISSVHFRVDLSQINFPEMSELIRNRNLFRAARSTD